MSPGSGGRPRRAAPRPGPRASFRNALPTGHPHAVATTCGGTCAPRHHWAVPRRASRALLASAVPHVLPAVARTAAALGLTVAGSPSLLDVVDPRDGRGHRPALPAAGPRAHRRRDRRRPGGHRSAQDGALLAAHLLTAPTLAVELARRGVTVEVGVLTEAELWSVYQPIVSLADRSVVAHEALLRGSVDGREVGGGDLFFVAESAGWLHHLDRIGRESAVSGAAGWLGDHDLYVNVHPTSIVRPQVCLAGTEVAAHDAGIAPGRLVFEVVESQVVADRGHLMSVLEHYRSLGWRVALDDVGAGWSSMSLLRTVKPDVVKLDKALVHELPDRGCAHRRPDGDRAGSSAGRRGRRRGRRDRAARRRGDGARCRPGQGWLFGRPVRPEPLAVEASSRFQPVERRPAVDRSERTERAQRSWLSRAVSAAPRR